MSMCIGNTELCLQSRHALLISPSSSSLTTNSPPSAAVAKKFQAALCDGGGVPPHSVIFFLLTFWAAAFHDGGRGGGGYPNHGHFPSLGFLNPSLRGDFKYYFADFVCEQTEKGNFGTSHIYSFMITVLHYSSGREHCYLILWQDFPNLVFTAITPQAVLICSQHFACTMGQRSMQQCVRGQ